MRSEGLTTTRRRGGGIRRARLLTALTTAALAALGAGAALSADVPSAPDRGAWVTDGPVHALARAGGRTYIGGEFEHVGRRTGHGVQLATGGSGDLSPGIGAFPEVAGGQVRVAVSDAAGGWFIGGDFTHVGGEPHARLAHVEPDGAGALRADSDWNPQPTGAIYALALGASATEKAVAGHGVLYVGGDFDSIGASSHHAFAGALDAGSGALLADWNPGPNAPVRALAVAPVQFDVAGSPTEMSAVVLGGDFTALDEQPTGALGAAWGLGAKAPDGAPVAGRIAWNGGRTPPVRALAVSPTRAGPVPNISTNPASQTFAVYDGKDAGLNATRVTLTPTAGPPPGYSVSTGAYFNWNPNAACDNCALSIRGLALSGETLYVGGRFTKIGANGAAHPSLAALTAIMDPRDGGFGGTPATAKNWGAGVPEGVVTALAASADAVYVAGDFARVANGAAERDRAAVAAFAPTPDAANPAILDWDPHPTGGLTNSRGGVVNTVAASESGVYVGGSFTSIRADAVRNLAVLDSAGALDRSWTPNPDGAVRALSAANGRLYIGGDFDNVLGSARSRLAATSLADGSLDAGWNPGAGPSGDGPAQVLALSATDQAVYVGGAFGTLASVNRQNAGALDSATAAATGWNPQPDGNVYALLATCGAVYTGGNFTHAGGQERNRLAALDPATGAVSDWNPDANAAVFALAQDAGTVYVGGLFSLLDGAARQKLAAVSLETGDVTSWTANVDGESVRALAAPPGEGVLYAGGRFDGVRGHTRGNVAAIARNSGEPTAWNPGTADAIAGTSDTVRSLAAEGPAVYVGGDFRQVGDPPAIQAGFASFGSSLAAGAAPVACAPPEEPVVVPQEPPPAPVAERSVEPPPIVTDIVAPVLSRVRVKPRRFRIGGPRRKLRGTVFLYKLSEPASVESEFQAARPCKARRTRRRCTRWVTVGTRAYESAAGRNRKWFNGKVRKRVARGFRKRYLEPGRYRALIRATDAAGNLSRDSRVRFRILAR